MDPAREADLEQLLRRHKITLRRRFGQNFLIDPALRDEIAAAAGATGDDDVLEVGAGVGTLTIALASLARRVIAVELDRDLIPALREVIGSGTADRPVESRFGHSARFGCAPALPRSSSRSSRNAREFPVITAASLE